MNTDIAQGKWKQLKGEIQQRWGDLTDDDLDRINGSREKFAGVMDKLVARATPDLHGIKKLHKCQTRSVTHYR